MNEIEDELKEVKIHQIMTKDIVAASPSNKFSQAFQFFCEKNINHLPVCENGELLGIISNKDMMRHVYKHLLIDKKTDITSLDNELKLTDVMTSKPFSVSANTTVLDVKEIFGKAPFNCLPVTHEGKLVGLVTPKDLMQMRIIHIDGSHYGGY